MAEDIDNRIICFMEEELPKGHFEHTTREICKGTGLTYTEVTKSLERLTTKNLIDFRKRGSSKKFIPYYYLIKLKRTFEREEKVSKREPIHK
jgi:transcription initiation factor IIE alpha subunit